MDEFQVFQYLKYNLTIHTNIDRYDGNKIEVILKLKNPATGDNEVVDSDHFYN